MGFPVSSVVDEFDVGIGEGELEDVVQDEQNLNGDGVKQPCQEKEAAHRKVHSLNEYDLPSAVHSEPLASPGSASLRTLSAICSAMAVDSRALSSLFFLLTTFRCSLVSLRAATPRRSSVR